MAYMNRFNQSDEGRRDELIRIIEHLTGKEAIELVGMRNARG